LKKMGKSLEARVQVRGGGVGVQEAGLLAEACLVSGVEIVTGGSEVEVAVFPAEGKKCERCWKYEESVGQKEAHSTLCGRCAEVVAGIGS
jgi:isoleucyl-tRNA synthetase